MCPLEVMQGDVEMGSHCSVRKRGKSKEQQRRGEERNARDLWDSSVGSGELQGKKRLENHCQDEEMPQGGISMSPAMCP